MTVARTHGRRAGRRPRAGFVPASTIGCQPRSRSRGTRSMPRAGRPRSIVRCMAGRLSRSIATRGKSARTDDLVKRPAFQQLLADAESGLLDVIVVHKLDRFSRNLRVTLETLSGPAGRRGLRLDLRTDGLHHPHRQDHPRHPRRLRPVLLRQFGHRGQEGARPSARPKASTTASCPSASSRIEMVSPFPIPRPTRGFCWPSASPPRARATGTWLRRSTPPGTARREPGTQPLHQGHRLPPAAEPLLPRDTPRRARRVGARRARTGARR